MPQQQVDAVALQLADNYLSCHPYSKAHMSDELWQHVGLDPAAYSTAIEHAHTFRLLRSPALPISGLRQRAQKRVDDRVEERYDETVNRAIALAVKEALNDA